ncbi:MAG: TolC family outer membrane protein [Hyphomonadaceae bacterium]|nr:TolC family outer membrane protein [Hyphomonadaceae bacterium]
MTLNKINKMIVSGLVVAHAFFSGAVTAQAEDFQQALVSAYQGNPGLMSERARVREIDENYIQAQAAGRLNAGVDASIGQTAFDTDIFFGQGGSVSTSGQLTPKIAQLNIIKPIYQGGRVKALKAQAKAGILAARQNLRSKEQDVLVAAATAFVDVLRDEEAARIRRNNVRVLTRQREAAQARFDVGAGTRTDIAQSNARLAAAEIGLANADAQLASSRAAYVRYMGHIPEQLSTPPTFYLPASLEDALQRGRSNNPLVVASRYNENAARSAIEVAKAAGKPSLSINGGLQTNSDTSTSVPRSDGASITAQLRIPFYSGGGNRSKIRAANQAKIRSKFETRELEMIVDQSISNLWAQVEAARRSVVASRQQVDAAEIAFEGVELERDVGTRNTLDVLDAEQEVLDAKLSVLQAERNLNVATYQLLGAIGGFDAYALQLPVDLYDPTQNLREHQIQGLGPQIKDFFEIDRKNVLEYNPVDPESIDPSPTKTISRHK